MRTLVVLASFMTVAAAGHCSSAAAPATEKRPRQITVSPGHLPPPRCETIVAGIRRYWMLQVVTERGGYMLTTGRYRRQGLLDMNVDERRMEIVESELDTMVPALEKPGASNA